jgi:transposase InsO family protein
MDFFTVPTVRFQILYIFVILNHSRRQVVHFAVTAHPTMAWVIQQLREAMPFGQQPSYLFRDNDAIYGDEVGRFLAGTGIEKVKTARRCPWQNPFVERYGGSLRRELLDHVIVRNEEHLKPLLKEFIAEYYHLARPHQGLNGDTPVPSAKPEPAADVRRLWFRFPLSAVYITATSEWLPNLLSNKRPQKNERQLIGAITGTNSKREASSGGRLA